MVFVVLHVSTPYKSTYFTFGLKIFIFVPLEMFLALYAFPRMLKMTLALLILFFTSASVPDRPSNGTQKAKEAEGGLETPVVETQSQN
jgi:hypothetical protein